MAFFNIWQVFNLELRPLKAHAQTKRRRGLGVRVLVCDNELFNEQSARSPLSHTHARGGGNFHDFVRGCWLSCRVFSFVFALVFYPNTHTQTQSRAHTQVNLPFARYRTKAHTHIQTHIHSHKGHKPWQKSINIFTRLEGACQAYNRFAMCLNNKLLKLWMRNAIVSHTRTHTHTQAGTHMWDVYTLFASLLHIHIACF